MRTALLFVSVLGPALPMLAQAADAPAASTGDEVPAEPVPDVAPKPGWEVALSGYVRAPIMLGVSRRPDPSDPSGARQLQLTYAPNRLLDADYNSFSYTRLEEGDWAELYVTARRPHVAATVGLMGRWLAWAGYEDGNTGWLPAQAWVELDSDVSLGSLRPNVKLQGGVFWQRWGTFDKYDTYMFGRFHQAGAAIQARLPLGRTELRLVEGFGTNRNGAPDAGTGLSLLHYTQLGLRYGKLLEAGLYYNSSWTRDPSLFFGSGTAPEQTPVPPGPNGEPGGGAYADARDAHVNVYGADVHLRVPRVGHGWLAASHIDVENGWALPGIVEVIHSPGGAGLAENYLALGSPGSSGTGSLVSLALLYETSLQGLAGAPEGSWPDLALSVFGMLVNARRELAPDAALARDADQLKWGSDLTLTLEPWLALMARYDQVDLDTNAPGHAFRVVTPRITFTSHILATESIWLQYSRYFYDDDLTLETSATQPYPHPDQHVIKLQANLSF